MLPSELKESKRPHGAERPFPWRCRRCGESEVFAATTRYQAEGRHDGRVYGFEIPAIEMPVCRACGAKVITESVDREVTDSLREHLHLLTPTDLHAALARVQMTPKDAAERLGIPEDAFTLWLSGNQLQSRAFDNLMRVFFAFPEVRAALNGQSQDPSLGIIDVAAQR